MKVENSGMFNIGKAMAEPNTLKTIGQEKRDLSKIVFNLTNAAMWSDSFEQEEKQVAFDQYLVSMFQRWRDCRDQGIKAQFKEKLGKVIPVAKADFPLYSEAGPPAKQAHAVLNYKDYVPRATFEDAQATIEILHKTNDEWRDHNRKQEDRLERQKETIHGFYKKFDKMRAIMAAAEVDGA